MNGKLGTEGNSFHFKQTILDVKTQTANKYTIRLFIIVKNLFTLTRGQWKTKWNTNKSFFFFWWKWKTHEQDFVIMHQTVSFAFKKGCIYSTGCKQLQVKGQCIYYPTRKGIAYIIQSASASHLNWTHSTALVTLYTGWFHFKTRLAFSAFSKQVLPSSILPPPLQYGIHFQVAKHKLIVL